MFPRTFKAGAGQVGRAVWLPSCLACLSACHCPAPTHGSETTAVSGTVRGRLQGQQTEQRGGQKSPPTPLSHAPSQMNPQATGLPCKGSLLATSCLVGRSHVALGRAFGTG